LGCCQIGFKCLVLGYDITDDACEKCSLYCKLNPNCDYKGEIKNDKLNLSGKVENETV